MTKTVLIKFLDRQTSPHILTLTLLAGVSALNTSIFLPSLAQMADYFGTDYSVMQFSVSGYLLVTAFLQIGIGPIADRFGRRSLVIWSLVLFLLATAGAVMATSIEVFLAFRMLQAVVAGGVVLSRAIVRDMYPPEQSASVIGYVTMGMALVPMFGPMIGGALEQFFDWRATFVFLLLAGAAVLWLCWRDLGETLKGGGLSFSEQLRTYPELLGSPRFWGYVLAAALGSGAFFALLGGGAFVAETVFHLSPFWTGIALGAPALGYAFGNGLSGRYSIRQGIDRMALTGTVISTLGMGISLGWTLLGATNPYAFFGFCTLLGIGNGMLLPNTTAGALSVRSHLAGTASGLSAAIMIGGGAALSALAGAVLSAEAGALPLNILMFATSALAVVAMVFVTRRNRRIT